MSARALRIFALIVPSLVVALVTLDAGPGMVHTAGEILVWLWLTAMAAVAMLAIAARRSGTPVLARIDVLSANGAAMMSFGAVALFSSALLGWASLSVVGVLGVGIVYVSVIWAALVAIGDAPWRHATITRTIIPERSTEGEPLREEIRIADMHIPLGMRLFITGRAMRHGPLSRYTLDSSASRTDTKLEGDLGPALRGEHHAPPLEMWLGDVLGLTRMPTMHRADVSFTVLPRVMKVDNTRQLLGTGGDASESVPTTTMPTEGVFRIREYVDGDDTRRIHWLRSLQSDRLIVRLPDEIPPADPSVRLVLDNELAGIETLTCRAPDDMLDVLVRLWLGIGKALADTGTRVTLVAAVKNGDIITPVERTLVMRSPREPVQLLGARVTWQSARPLASLLADRRERQIVVSARPRYVRPGITWIAVPEVAWTTFEPQVSREAALTYSYPTGAVENRAQRRSIAHAKAFTRWQDRTLFSQVLCWTDWSRFSGQHIARPDRDRAVLEVIP